MINEKNSSNAEFVIFSGIESYYDFNQPVSIPSIYRRIVGNRLGKFFLEEDDNLTEEIAKYIEKSNSFAFLSNPEEDIYTFDDGESIC